MYAIIAAYRKVLLGNVPGLTNADIGWHWNYLVISIVLVGRTVPARPVLLPPHRAALRRYRLSDVELHEAQSSASKTRQGVLPRLGKLDRHQTFRDARDRTLREDAAHAGAPAVRGPAKSRRRVLGVRGTSFEVNRARWSGSSAATARARARC